MKIRAAVGQLYNDAYTSLTRHIQTGGDRHPFKLLLDYADAHGVALLTHGATSDDIPTPLEMAELRGKVKAWEEISQILGRIIAYQPPKKGNVEPEHVFVGMFPAGPGKAEGM